MAVECAWLSRKGEYDRFIALAKKRQTWNFLSATTYGDYFSAIFQLTKLRNEKQKGSAGKREYKFPIRSSRFAFQFI
jgi:hypothetical protein